MKKTSPPDPESESRIRSSFAQQGIMKTIGARLLSVDPGEVRIELPYSKAITQQHGFVHAGILSTIADNACGYAA
jgi:acyl-coenzyme A thioesterase PaaI-like protein